jgi:Flp pilus assembly protein TadB
MWEWLAEHWQLPVIAGTGLLALAVRRRVARWVLASCALLVAAVVLSWAFGMSWHGALVIFLALLVIASALWLGAEERRAERLPAGSETLPGQDGP